MTVKQLLALIPTDTFKELAITTHVDYQVKTLSGEVMFKLILFSMLHSDKLSLRVMETFLESAQFKSFTGYDILEGKFNSIRDRICTINVNYFEQLFEKIFLIYNKQLQEENALTKVDSTYVALASKVFSIGMKHGRRDKRFVKYSIGLKGNLPSSAKVFVTQSHISEDLALTEVINDDERLKNSVVVFDRGLQSRASFDKFTKDDKLFISRANPNIRLTDITSRTLLSKPQTATVTVLSDDLGRLINKKEQPTQYQYRVIQAVIDASNDRINFVTNILDEDAYVIAGWYKQRWEIETFFKFIKQHLNTKHLVSRNLNGIKVMLYMTLILATLIIAYKKLNNIRSFKIAKLKLEIELERDIIKTIVELCGGDPLKAPQFFNSS